MQAAEDAGFDVLLTTDTNLPHQQNLQGRKRAVIILGKNRWKLIEPKMKEIVAAVDAARPGAYSVVEIRQYRIEAPAGSARALRTT